MNYANFIVKIIEKPSQTVFNNEITVTRFNAEFPKLDNQKFETIIQVVIWGNFLNDISQYFFVGDYIIVEGYISTRNTVYNGRQLELSVFKVYPFLFYSN